MTPAFEPEHVVVDMDDVTLNFVEGVLEVANRDYDVQLRASDVVGWNFGEYGLDAALGQDWWKWLEEHAWLWAEKFRPVPGAIGGIEKLRRAGHWVEALTMKPPWAEWTVWHWIAKYRVPFSQVTLAPWHSTKNGEPVKKSSLTKGRILIDDRDKNINEWTESRPGRIGIIYTRAHNRHHSLRERQYRADDWHEVLAIIERVAEGVYV
jgi:5'(3')-deoxyribonucleotidase